MFKSPVWRYLPDHGAPDEAVLDWEHMWILVGIGHTYVSQFDVQVLKDFYQLLYVILETFHLVNYKVIL